MSKSTLSILVIFLISIGLAVFSVNTDDYQPLKKQLKVSHILHNTNKKLPDFSLIDHNKQVFDNARLKGKWTLLTFIYTHCPDVCPTVLMDMSMLKSSLIKKDIEAEFVVITFDPLRDTPEVLKTYVTHFDKNFLGVSGEQKQIDQLIKPFGTYYERSVEIDGKSVIIPNGQPMPKDTTGYSINHTAWLYLISPDGQIFAGFPTPHTPSSMAKDIELPVKSY